MQPSRVTVDLAREEDTNRILELNRLEYGPDDILTTSADFAWRRDQNPAGQAIIPVIRDSHDEVVGFVWVVPLHMRIEGQDYRAATGTNLVVHPEHRNTFGYAKLIRRFEQVFEDHGIPLHFSFVSEKTYRRQRERTPRAVATIPLLVKPLDFSALAETYFKNREWLGALTGRAGSVASAFFFRRRPVGCAADITVGASGQFDNRFDEFWLTVRDKYPAMLIRDRAFLAWRFAGVSGRHYRILVARAGDQALGYVVLRTSTIRGIKTGLVMDLLVANGGSGEMGGTRLMAEAEAYFHSMGVSLAAGLMPPLAAEYRILRQAGYRPLPPVLAPRRFRFAFFVHKTGEKAVFPLSARDWFVTLADYESF
jgi:GNAT superfamily N-acetyltransferase